MVDILFQTIFSPMVEKIILTNLKFVSGKLITKYFEFPHSRIPTV